MGPTVQSYRDAILGFARGALATKVAEVPLGSHRGPQVDAYVAGCIRNGRLLGLRGVAWCASFVSWCVWQGWSLANDGADPSAHEQHWPSGSELLLPPVGYRAAVSELIRDAKTVGAWHEGPDYVVLPGDLACMMRGGHDPRLGGDGHVAIVDEALVDGSGWWCIGGNESHAVRRTFRPLERPGVRSSATEPIVGFVTMGYGLPLAQPAEDG